MEQMIPGGILYNILSLDTTVHTSWCRTAADSFLFHSSIIGEQVWNQTNLLYFLPDAAQPSPDQAPTRAWPFLRRCNDAVAEERLRPQAECGDDCAAVTCILSVLNVTELQCSRYEDNCEWLQRVTSSSIITHLILLQVAK